MKIKVSVWFQFFWKTKRRFLKWFIFYVNSFLFQFSRVRDELLFISINNHHRFIAYGLTRYTILICSYPERLVLRSQHRNNELINLQLVYRKMDKSAHRLQSEDKKDTTIASPRPETEWFSLGTCLNTTVIFSNRLI